MFLSLQVVQMRWCGKTVGLFKWLVRAGKTVAHYNGQLEGQSDNTTDWQGPGKANKEKKKAAMRDSMQHSFLHVKLRALHQTPSSA